MNAETPTTAPTDREATEREADLIARIARRAFVFATKMIYDANHRPDAQPGDPKVGGHPAACSSCIHILSALHFGVRRPEDLFAIKPHASPNDHSINYLLRTLHSSPMGTRWLDGEESKVAMSGLRKFSESGEPVFQSYHSEWDPDGYYYFPSGSVGIPPVVSMYTSLAYRYAKDHHFEVPDPEPHFWSLVGDSEFREGSLMEAMPDAAERELNNVCWIVDYNRQNLDGTRIPNPKGLRGTDGDRMARVGLSNGWKVVQLRHGRKRKAAFARQGGDLLRHVLEHEFSDYSFQVLLLSRNGAVIREQLIAKEAGLEALLAPISDGDLFDIFADLGGHDVFELLTALRRVRQEKNAPTLVIAHTIKGWGLSSFAAPGNHSWMPDQEEVDKLLESEGLPAGDPYSHFEEGTPEGDFLAAKSREMRTGIEALWELRERNLSGFAKETEQVGGLPDTLGLNLKLTPFIHTQYIWGQLAAKLIRVGNSREKDRRGEPEKELSGDERRWGAAAELVLTMAPDVGTSTNINPAMDERIYGPSAEQDLEDELGLRDRRRPKLLPREDAWTRHIRFEIAEANCMSAAGAFGKMRDRLGIPFLPIMTIYDFFIKRAYDQLYYNLYWQSGFIVVGTPSGVTLSPEGAQHSWKSDIQMPNVITWEPFYALEVDWILSESVRLHHLGQNQGRSGVVIRCVTRAFKQGEMIERLRGARRFAGLGDDQILEVTRRDALAGAYYLVDWRGQEGYEPGENVVNIMAMGAMGSEALAAADMLHDDGIFANVIIVTSGDLLCGNLAHAGGYIHLREGLGINGDLHLAKRNGSGPPAVQIADRVDMILAAGRRVPVVTVVDGEAGLLDNVGSIVGVRAETLGVRKASKSGRPIDVYQYLHIEPASIRVACGRVLTETALEDVRISRALVEEAAERPAERPGRKEELARVMWPPRA